MTYDKLAGLDFERARRKAFWRKLFTWVGGNSNELLPFDTVREHLPINGQFYRGLRQVLIDRIVGSFGRYNDFDRAFLPLQTRTRGRWVNIDKAHYENIDLPPVELFKMGDIYFVKDGNHRVSVARERGQEFIDAYVTEIVVPIPVTAETRLDEIILKKEQIAFLEKTRLDELRPGNHIRTLHEGEYSELLDHISVHRWYLGERHKREIGYQEAVESWYDNVYAPLVKELDDHGLLEELSSTTETELYLWIMKYVYYLRQAFREEPPLEKVAGESGVQIVKAEAAKQVKGDELLPRLNKLASVVQKSHWVEDLILSQERADFNLSSGIQNLFPDAQIETSIPGQYEKLLEHIDVHRWYLGEKLGSEAPYQDAVVSWYKQVYLPLVTIIREQNILADFPGRTETDLYLWIISHQWYLRDTLGDDVSVETAAELFAEDYAQKQAKGLLAALKKATGIE